MKTMLITGGARGIGAQMVRHFAAQGWRVMFCYQSSQEKAEALARETGALAVRCDVRDEAQVRAMLAQAMASLRHLDALICNAGAAWTGLTEEMPLAEAGTVTESAEEFGDSSDSIADIAEEGNIEAKEKGELTALCCVVSPFLCVMKFLNCKAVDCVRNPSGKIRI